jgi:hypothetical protein
VLSLEFQADDQLSQKLPALVLSYVGALKLFDYENITIYHLAFHKSKIYIFCWMVAALTALTGHIISSLRSKAHSSVVCTKRISTWYDHWQKDTNMKDWIDAVSRIFHSKGI